MIVIRECDKMKILYKNKKVERMCKDLSYAKREINQYSIKLHSLINLIENAANLNDVARMGIYYLHPPGRQGKRQVRIGYCRPKSWMAIDHYPFK